MECPQLSLETLKNEADMRSWCSIFEQKLNANNGNNAFQVEASLDDETGAYLPKVTYMLHGLQQFACIPKSFFNSPEYLQITQFQDKIVHLLEPGAFVQRNDQKISVTTFSEVVEWLMNQAQKGQTIQRYKGLGEMNPDQLWETTMNPDTRRLLQVTIEDAIQADQVFTTLMGDQVEPRRDFIERNALEATNIDV